MKDLLIFGTGKNAELAHYYFSTDSDYEVVGFTIDSQYIESNEFCGLPIYAYEELESKFSLKDIYIFVAIGSSRMNKDREEKIKEIKVKGFRLASYISSHITILDNVKIGEHCFIIENNSIKPFVEIGDNNMLWGCGIGHHSIIGHNNFIAGQVAVCGNIVIGNNCFIGANSTLRDGITIANQTLIGAASYISRNTVEKGVYRSSFAEKLDINSDQVKGM